MYETDFSSVHAAPGLGQQLEYVPSGPEDPLYIREPIGNALEKLYECSYVPSLAALRWHLNSHHKWLFRLSLTTLREFAMLGFINAVTDKVDWHKKVCVLPYHLLS